ncbi:hypothetical protein [Arenimonas sp.]|uniref:hypothetical protein n=1 Tax=Arenimonas sp. TaxID=1872635 RepID=UPI0039E58A23
MAPRSPARFLGWSAAAIALSAAVALAVWREPLGRFLLPDPRLNQRLAAADAALARGELTRADGKGARELYEAVLAADPDQLAAQQGLARIRAAVLVNIDRALRAHRLEEARTQLGLAASLSVPQEQLQPLQARLLELDRSAARLPEWLAAAQRPGATAKQALEAYEAILAVDAGNAIALEGRSEVLGRELERAQALLTQRRLAEAEAIVAAVIARDPAHLDLPEAQAALGEARDRRQRQLAGLLRTAQRDQRAGRCERAAKRYQQVLADDAGRLVAREGLQACASKLLQRANEQIARQDFASAERGLAQARSWSPELPGLTAARRHLRQARADQARLQTRSQVTQLPQLLAEARDAIRTEHFLEPPGASAWDRLRVAASIAPGSEELKKVQNEYRRAARSCHEQGLVENDLGRAQACLEALVAIDPGDTRLVPARLQLAERWLAYAEERIGASDFVAARRALNAAQAIDASNARLAAMEARLRQAEGVPQARQP